MRTFVLFVAGFVVGTVVMNACGKKVEPAVDAGTPAAVVEPAKLEAVPAAAPLADAGVPTVVPAAEGGKMESGTPTVQSVPAVQTAVEQK